MVKSTAVADNRVLLRDIERAQKLIDNSVGIQGTFEGIDYASITVSQIDFVNVTDSLGPSQSPS